MKLKKNWIIYLIVGLLLLGVVGGGIVGILKLTDTGKLDTKTISSTKFSVGGLDSNGKYMNTNTSIYTKEAFECQGLEVSLDFDNEIEYQIYFYDQNNDFVHTTGKLSGASVKDSVPFFAKYARIVVTPKNDDVVSKIEVLKYARQLTVKVNREQGYKNYSENLFIVDQTGSYKLDTNGEVADSGDSNTYNVSKFIDCRQYDDMLVFRVDDFGTAENTTLYFYNAEKTFVTSLRVGTIAKTFNSSTGITYFTLDLSDLDESVCFARTYVSSKYDLRIYCR